MSKRNVKVSFGGREEGREEEKERKKNNFGTISERDKSPDWRCIQTMGFTAGQRTRIDDVMRQYVRME